jgi:hypothetical protein
VFWDFGQKYGPDYRTAWRYQFIDQRSVTDGVVTLRSSSFWGRNMGRIIVPISGPEYQFRSLYFGHEKTFWTHRSIDRTIDLAIDVGIDRASDRSSDRTIERSSNRSSDRSIHRSIDWSIEESA